MISSKRKTFLEQLMNKCLSIATLELVFCYHTERHFLGRAQITWINFERREGLGPSVVDAYQRSRVRLKFRKATLRKE